MNYNPYPDWSFKPGIIFRLTESTSVVDEDNDTLVLEEGSLMMTCGSGMFVMMETGCTFTCDELDARIIEFGAELL